MSGIRKTLPIIITIGLSLSLLLAGGPVAAQGEPGISQSTARVQFPASITFKLDVRGSASITDIRLHYRLEHDSFARVVDEIKPDFTPALFSACARSWASPRALTPPSAWAWQPLS